MLKQLLRKKKQEEQDVRFVNYEDYRVMSGEQTQPTTRPKIRHTVYYPDRRKENRFDANPLTIDFVFEDQTPCDRISKNARDGTLDEAIFVEQTRNVTDSELSLGVFSDARNYTEFLRSELENSEIACKHFNHPCSLHQENYPFFDTISAWMIYLSEDCDGKFLNEFMDRYYDKPTLFLCPNTDRSKTRLKIQRFIASLESA